MANINAVNLDYIKRWEGGLSKLRGDQAAKDPVPDGSGYHTNKGVTWSTFKGLASKIGYVATPKLFYEMPFNIWLSIYKIGFWNPMNADNINNQIIAELLADWAWGSGPGIAARQTQLYLISKGYKIAADGAFGPVSTKALNDLIKKQGAQKTYEEIFKYRVNWIKRLGSNPAYSEFLNGWLNRLSDFYTITKDKVTKNPEIPIGLVLIGLGALLYWGFKNGDTKKTFGVSEAQALVMQGDA